MNSSVTRARVGAYPCGFLRQAQQVLGGGCEGDEIVRVVEQHSVIAVRNLVNDSPDRRGDHGSRLPHGLCDGEPEPLREALLHHDRRVALQGVDDRCVFVRVGHRDAGEMDAIPGGVRKRAPGVDAFLQYLGSLRIV